MNGRMNAKKSYVKPEEVIVNELIKALEDGVPVWRKEWTVKGGFRNLLTGKTYQGSNPALLCISSAVRGWHLPYLLEEVKLSRLAVYLKKGLSLLEFATLQRSLNSKKKTKMGRFNSVLT